MRRGHQGGFTLVELLVSMIILGTVFGAMIGAVISMQRGYIRQREVSRAEDALRVAEVALLTVLRGAGANPLAIAGPGITPDPLGHGVFDNLLVVSDFNPADGDASDPLERVQVWTAQDTLFASWQSGQAGAPIAFPVRSMQVEYFSSTGTLLTLPAQVASATRARFTLVAPKHSRTTALVRRQTWVQLRNRS